MMFYLARCTHNVSVTPGKQWPSQATPRPPNSFYCHARDRGLVFTLNYECGLIVASSPQSPVSRHHASRHRCSWHPASVHHRCSKHLVGEAALSGHPAKWHGCSKHPARHATRHRCSKHSTNAATHATQPRHHGCQHCANPSHVDSPPVLFVLPSVPVFRRRPLSYVAGYGSPKNTLKACDHRA